MTAHRKLQKALLPLAAAGALALAGEAAAAPDECPTIMPTSSLTPGMTGEGWTVTQGTVPEQFDVEVLDVLPNAIGAGRDMIIVEVSNNPTIDDVGGIWFGMSGSPVYVGGQLIGAVAFGLTFAPSKIAGLTPASELVTVNDYPVTSATSARAKVRVPKAVARRLARRAGVPTKAASTFNRLKMPLSVSGLEDRGLKRVRALARRHGAQVVPYAGASTSAVTPADPSEIVPGGNFAAALSYGDVTLAGVGTTSYVCDGRATAFGHPLFQLGKTSMSASVADAITIVGDALGGPFKLATIGGSVGVLDQDRIAGIRGLLGTSLSSTPIVTQLASRDTNRQRTGQTDAVFLDALPDLAFIHLLSNVDSVQDAIGPGSARLNWEVNGTDNGEPWTLDRRDIFASDFDLAFDPALTIADAVFAIRSFRNEGVEIDDVSVGGWVEQTYRALRIHRVLVKRGGEFRLVGDEISARPGQLVRLRVVLKPAEGGANKTVHLRVRMPNRPRFTLIDIVGGPPLDFCEDEVCAGPESFDELLDELQNRRRNNVLAASVLVGDALVERSVATQNVYRKVEGQRTIFVSLD